jgi:hypothetical protein
MQRPYMHRSGNNKALLLSQQGFFFVAETDKISNLKLILGMIEIREFNELELLLLR